MVHAPTVKRVHRVVPRLIERVWIGLSCIQVRLGRGRESRTGAYHRGAARTQDIHVRALPGERGFSRIQQHAELRTRLCDHHWTGNERRARHNVFYRLAVEYHQLCRHFGKAHFPSRRRRWSTAVCGQTDLSRPDHPRRGA